MESKLSQIMKQVTPWRAVLAVIVGLGLYVAVVRYAQGLGASTNLSDEFPWGLWIGFDLLVGVGLAAGGFVIAATVHVFKIEKYEPIARPTVLTAFLGYLLVIVALLFDLGRPYRIWHPLIMWNPHSVMFEVGWCVTLYTTVLAVEFSPLVFERLNLQRPLRIIRSIFVPLVVVGVLLSTLHQSSLGTLYVIAQNRLHGLWYTPLLPVFFFLTAVAGGLAMTIFESYMSARAFGKQLDPELLRGLARVAVVVLGVYTVWKAVDLAGRGNLDLVFRITPESVMFWGEMGLGAILPMALFASRWMRRNDSALFFAATLTILGFIVGRLNVAITGMVGSAGVSYVPSWMEFAVSICIVAVGFALFGLAAKYLPVFPQHEAKAHGVVFVPPPMPILSRNMLIGLWGLAMVGGALLFYAASREPVMHAASPASSGAPAAAPAGDVDLRLPQAYAFPASEVSPGRVVFDHESHVLADDPGCGTCHASLFRLHEPGRPVQGEVTYQRVHEGDLCASCHGGEHAFAIGEGCMYCHRLE